MAQIPHIVRVAVLGCFDDRLLSAQYEAIIEHGGGFLIRMAGGGAALMTDRDHAAALGQITDAFGVHSFEKVVIHAHLGCGKLAGLTAEGGEMYGKLDPASASDLYRMGDEAAKRVHDALKDVHGVDIPVEVEIYDVVGGKNGAPTGELVARTLAHSA